MQLKGRHTQWIEVEVDTLSAFQALKAEVFKRAGIKRTAVYIHNGRICTDEEMHTSHSWYERLVVVETPTEEQLKLVEGFDAIWRVLNQVPRG